jgi:hypothetical protein
LLQASAGAGMLANPNINRIVNAVFSGILDESVVIRSVMRPQPDWLAGVRRVIVIRCIPKQIFWLSGSCSEIDSDTDHEISIMKSIVSMIA